MLVIPAVRKLKQEDLEFKIMRRLNKKMSPTNKKLSTVWAMIATCLFW
jgi:hypothetical protein